MMVVDVLLKGRLLAQYTCEQDDSGPHQDQIALIAMAKHNLLRDRLVDDRHLDQLDFKVRRP